LRLSFLTIKKYVYEQMEMYSKKWDAISETVRNLDAPSVGKILKKSKHEFIFFPSLGIFSNEFCVVYCNNLNGRRVQKSSIEPRG